MNMNQSLPVVPDYTESWAPYETGSSGLQCDCGEGVLSHYGGRAGLSNEALVFIVEQFKRFRVHLPDRDFISWCWNFAFYGVDQYDPYMFFYKASDVAKTNKPEYHQFSIKHGDRMEEVAPDILEHYELLPDGHKYFHELMRQPGLRDGPFDIIYDYLIETFEFGDEAGDLAFFYNKYGEKTQDLAHLGVWSALMWMISPEAKWWRYQSHPVFQYCYDHGECLLYEWDIIPPDSYLSVKRQPRSCANCGGDAYCVSLVQTRKSPNVLFLCTHCESDGLPFPGRNCGTRNCTKVECEHHPAFKLLSAQEKLRAIKKISADNRYGELKKIAGTPYSARSLPGPIVINQIMIDRYAKGIAGDVGRALDALLNPPTP